MDRAGAVAVERERTRQVARIGNDLSQIARWANTRAETTEAVESSPTWSPSGDRAAGPLRKLAGGRSRGWPASETSGRMHVKFIARG